MYSPSPIGHVLPPSTSPWMRSMAACRSACVAVGWKLMNMTLRAHRPRNPGGFVMMFAGAMRLSHKTLEIESGACAGTVACGAVDPTSTLGRGVEGRWD